MANQEQEYGVTQAADPEEVTRVEYHEGEPTPSAKGDPAGEAPKADASAEALAALKPSRQSIKTDSRPWKNCAAVARLSPMPPRP